MPTRTHTVGAEPGEHRRWPQTRLTRQSRDRVEAAPPDALARESREESTAFSHEPDVGVKWNVQRGCRASQAFTFGCLWVA
jgi:hypothetical protein